MKTRIRCIDSFIHQGFKQVGVLNHYCEDRIVTASSIYAVIDGATALRDVDMNGLNTSAYTAQFLCEFLAQAFPETMSAGDILVAANTAFRAHLERDWPHVLDLGKLGPCAAVVLCRFHEDQTVSMANVADCSLVVETDDGWQRLSYHEPRHDELDAQMADLIFETARDKNITPNEARYLPTMADAIRGTRMLANVEYGNFNGEPDMVRFMKQDRIPMRGLKTIVMFSDGMEWPDDKNDLVGTAQKIAAQGAHAYYLGMKNKFDKDPNFTTYRRLKHMDDASAVVVHLNTEQ